MLRYAKSGTCPTKSQELLRACVLQHIATGALNPERIIRLASEGLNQLNLKGPQCSQLEDLDDSRAGNEIERVKECQCSSWSTFIGFL